MSYNVIVAEKRFVKKKKMITFNKRHYYIIFTVVQIVVNNYIELTLKGGTPTTDYIYRRRLQLLIYDDTVRFEICL